MGWRREEPGGGGLDDIVIATNELAAGLCGLTVRHTPAWLRIIARGAGGARVLGDKPASIRAVLRH
jgi:hypothetical protein